MNSHHKEQKGLEELFQAILQLENIEECRCFFDDLCTISELQALAQRWAVAKLLDQDTKYQQISTTTGASTATISRVNRCLMYGADGYRLLLDRMKDDHEIETEE